MSTENNTNLPINETILNNTVILISNSLLDGSREGDGDLMDGILFELKRRNYSAFRITENKLKIPKDYDNKNLIIPLSDKQMLPIEELQSIFIKKLETEFANKNIILYIGSRFDAINNFSDFNKRSLAGSGSLFSDKFIKELKLNKKFNVKIVICCLEFKFFKRSINALQCGFEMLRQHLFLADKIHFLTEHDKTNFEKTLHQLTQTNNFTFSPHLPITIEVKDKENFDLENEIKANGGLSFLNSLILKSTYISGIYTVKPLKNEEITHLFKPDIFKHIPKETFKDIEGNVNGDIVKILNFRSPHVLCFGLIRQEKGFQEAVELGKLFEENKKDNQIILIGRVMEAGGLMFADIISQIFKLPKKKVKLKIINTLDKIKSSPELGLPLNKQNEISQDTDFTMLSSIFKDNKEGLNYFLQQFYDELQEEHKQNRYILKLDASESQIKELAMKCKYAIKLDHKGMANNASTIASCLGLYLPTFTAAGLVTDDSFRDENFHRIKSTKEKTFGKYKMTLFMPKKEYKVDNKKQLIPKNYTANEIYQLIVDETDENYIKRLKQLVALHEDKVFDVENVVQKMINQIFEPLQNEFESQTPQYK